MYVIMYVSLDIELNLEKSCLALSSSGAGTSSDTVMTKFGSYIYAGFNTLRPRQDVRHFPDGIFKGIFLNENAWISTKISLKFVPKGPINNITALVQIMAWLWPGDKLLSEPMMVHLLMHILSLGLNELIQPTFQVYNS